MKWIRRASTKGINWCECPADEALSQIPGAGQLGCPWCGCGWLFSCVRCSKAYTFGVCVDVDQSPEALVRLTGRSMDLKGYDDPPADQRHVQERTRTSATLFADLEERLVVGQEYVVLDGRVLPAHGAAEFVGIRGCHVLSAPLQTEHRDSRDRMMKALGKDYWFAAEERKRSIS